MMLLLYAIITAQPSGYAKDPVDIIIKQLDDVSKKTDRMDDKLGAMQRDVGSKIDAIQTDLTEIKIATAVADPRITAVEKATAEISAAQGVHAEKISTLERFWYEAKANVAAIALATGFFMAIFNGALRFLWPAIGKVIKKHKGAS